MGDDPGPTKGCPAWHIAVISMVVLTLELALEFIEDDELVEITPSAIRLRKKFLKEHERKRSARS